MNKNNKKINTVEIPIIRKIYELYKIFYGYAALFPKKDKYTLGSKCEIYITDVLELLLAAASAPKYGKQALIQQASVKFDTLKIFLRLANDLDILDGKKYIELQKHIQEIGRMLGGWQRSFN